MSDTTDSQKPFAGTTPWRESWGQDPSQGTPISISSGSEETVYLDPLAFYPNYSGADQTAMREMEIQQDIDNLMVIQDPDNLNIEEPGEAIITLGTALDAARALIARRSTTAPGSSQPEQEERVAYSEGDVVMVKAEVMRVLSDTTAIVRIVGRDDTDEDIVHRITVYPADLTPVYTATSLQDRIKILERALDEATRQLGERAAPTASASAAGARGNYRAFRGFWVKDGDPSPEPENTHGLTATREGSKIIVRRPDGEIVMNSSNDLATVELLTREMEFRLQDIAVLRAVLDLLKRESTARAQTERIEQSVAEVAAELDRANAAEDSYAEVSVEALTDLLDAYRRESN